MMGTYQMLIFLLNYLLIRFLVPHHGETLNSFIFMLKLCHKPKKVFSVMRPLEKGIFCHCCCCYWCLL